MALKRDLKGGKLFATNIGKIADLNKAKTSLLQNVTRIKLAA